MNEVYKKSGLGKWFHSQSAGGEPGWDRYNTQGEKIGKCGDKKPGEGKPKCLSRQKAAKLRSQGGKKAIANAVRRKRAKDPVTDRPGTGNKPINVSNKINKEHQMLSFSQFITEKNVPNDPGKWASCIAQAKKKFDVYPSAYANAWASKCYKGKGGTWKSVKEEKQNCGCGQDPCITYGTQNEELDSEDKPTLKKIVKKLKGASQAHAGQAKDLEKAMEEDWQKVNRKDKTDGLSQKAVDAYRRENPGSKLQTAVTEKKPTGKRAARRKSFCSRMCGMKKRLTSAETSRDPDSRINKALRRWNCNCS